MLNKYAPETEEVNDRAYQIDLLLPAGTPSKI